MLSKIERLSDERNYARICNEMWDEYRKEYKVRGGVEMTGKGEPWHTKEEEEEELHYITLHSCSLLSYHTDINNKYNTHIPGVTAVQYLGFHREESNFLWPLMLTQGGPNHVFLFFPMAKWDFFLPKGAMAQWCHPKYAQWCHPKYATNRLPYFRQYSSIWTLENLK